jgi:hypothetical protein
VGQDGEDRGDRRRGVSRRPFADDLRADRRFERALLARGVAITAVVVALVALREALL